MKTITISDSDYETLMELSKELQVQDNNFQAFPYFWTPRSDTTERNPFDEGDIVVCYSIRDCKKYTPLEVKDEYGALWDSFIELCPECEDDEEEWISFIKEDVDFEVWTEDVIAKDEINPSLFYSDVEKFCKNNSHHLDNNPRTYSRTIWRMPKMKSLVECILRLNKNHGEEVNHEAKRFING